MYKPDKCTREGKEHFSCSGDNLAMRGQPLTFGEEIRVYNILGMMSMYVLSNGEVYMPIVSGSYDTSY
jgi:hypothetical protein